MPPADLRPRHRGADLPARPRLRRRRGLRQVDVEGHEEAVLEGARATIERCRPNILIESRNDARHALEHVRRFFKALDYRGYFIRRGRI